MALQFNVVEKYNPQTKDKKWYASPKQTGKHDLQDLSKEISQMSSLSQGDVYNTIMNLCEVLPKLLMEGNSVKLEGFGTFRLSFSSEGSVNKDDITANSIKDVYILFNPDEAIKEKVSHTKINPA